MKFSWLAAALALTATLATAAEPRIVYSKFFKGS